MQFRCYKFYIINGIFSFIFFLLLGGMISYYQYNQGRDSGLKEGYCAGWLDRHKHDLFAQEMSCSMYWKMMEERCKEDWKKRTWE